MSDEEVREFLMRWLMEFGSDYVDPYDSLWYRRHPVFTASQPVAAYFYAESMHKQRINQAGLDFLKGE